jgi:predicted dehydrogenase
MNRRSFLGTSAALVAGSTLLPRTAASYEKILGANDRISLGHIGTGHRGDDLDLIVSKLQSSHHAEMTAVCDLWKTNREKAVATNQKYYGRAPRAVQYPEELLAMKDLDGMLISTPEHSHSPILKMAAEAGKDAYVEKPMGNVLAEARAARDAVLRAKTVVQVGTQHRSEPYPNAAHEVVRSGALGEISKVEIVWNYHGPRWRGREEVQQIREQDTDWSKWLMTKPARPFDPQLYFEFRLYKEFSSGISDQWMSHGIDLVHWFMDDSVPRSVIAHGGVFAGMTAARIPTRSRPARISQGISGQLFDQLRQRRAQLHPLHGEEGDVDESGRRRQSALSSSRREGDARGRFRHRQEARVEVCAAAGRDLTAHGHRRPVARAHGQLVRLLALAQATERHRERRLRAFGGVHDGGPVVLGWEESVLGCRQRDDCRESCIR